MLVNDIYKFELSDYEEARQTVKALSESLPGLVNFGQFGVVGQPSISDLDIFICFDDENFKKNVEFIETEIKGNKKLNYIFPHPPLFIPKSLLSLAPYMHSFYNLKLDYEPKNLIKTDDVKNGYYTYLNLVWTIFLLPISLKIIKHPDKFGFRFALLVLKNLHQSLENLKPSHETQKQHLEKSEEIRGLAIANKLSSNEIINEYQITLKKLMEYMTLCKSGRSINFGKNVLRLPKRTKVIFSQECKFETSNRGTNYYLTEPFYEILYGMMGYQTLNENLNLHIEKSKAAFTILNNLTVSYPFIKPFGIPYFQSDINTRIKFYLKSLISGKEKIKPVIFEPIN